MLNKIVVDNWLLKLKNGWESKNIELVLELFEKTEKYYERPFNPGTSLMEFRKYSEDIG